MSRIWLQALFICKPRFHHWLTCLHWLLINELQKFVMHESFIWAGVTQTAGFPRDLRTPRGAELKVERDHPSAASQSPDSLTDLWPFGNDRRIHNCSANAHQQGGQGGCRGSTQNNANYQETRGLTRHCTGIYAQNMQIFRKSAAVKTLPHGLLPVCAATCSSVRPRCCTAL